jgi:hypothetical protein
MKVMESMRGCFAIIDPADMARYKRTPHNFCVYIWLPNLLRINGSRNQEDLHGSACRAPSIPDGDRSDDLRLAVPRTDARKLLGPIGNDAG